MAHSRSSDPIIIVGAGVGGLSAAIYLAAAGERVIMLEQHNRVGGKMGCWASDGFVWDTGPSVLTMRHVLEDVFRAGGTTLDERLTLVPVEPLTRYFYPNGKRLDATRDLPSFLGQLERLDRRDPEGYLRFAAHAAALHRITGDVFIYGRPPVVWDALHVPLRDILQVDGWRTMAGAARAYVHSPEMRQFLGRFATYLGASPYRAPAVLNVIAHVELSGGIWYPQGGMYRLVEAYETLARELGVEIRTETKVERIEVKDGRVVGVTLTDGSFVPARVVISNVDVTTLYDRLLDPAVGRRQRRWRRRLPHSGSGFVLMLGVDGVYPELAHHNVLFASDYRREFDQIFREGIPPQEPTIYITVTAKRDPEHAPAGCENWFVLLNVPPLGTGYDWAANRQAYRDLVLDQLALRGLDVRNRIRVERILTPLELEAETGAWQGALYGLSSNLLLAALMRPHNRARDVRGLYFAGGTAHPGGGVPMVTLSGRTAARMVLEDARQAA